MVLKSIASHIVDRDILLSTIDDPVFPVRKEGFQ